MKAPLYSEILTISQNIATASANNNDDEREKSCKALQVLCATNQNTPKDHPLQWEALGDFTEDGDQAIEIYEIGVTTAEKLQLNNYLASIYLAMAQRYNEFENMEQAQVFAKKANDVNIIDCDELKEEITEFLQKLNA